MGKLSIFLADKQYCLYTPTADILYNADVYANSLIEQNRFNNWIDSDYIKKYMEYNKIWTPEQDKNMEAIDKRIEDIKVEMYETIEQAVKEREKLRVTLKMVQEKLHKMYCTKHMLDYMTIEGFAASARNRYVFRHSLRVDKKRFRGNADSLQNIMGLLDQYRFTIEQLREIARSDEWCAVWSCQKQRAFRVIGDDQRTLMALTKMYEGARKHPECPPDTVINDDDRFDGWMILERRKSQLDKKKEISGNTYDKRHKNANEVFIMAKNQGEANDIFNYNSLEGKIMQRKRVAAVHQRGEVDEKDLPDVQQHLQMAALHMQKEHLKSVRGGK